MKKIFFSISFVLVFLLGICRADIPENAIRFVFDSHLYFEAKLNDSIPVSLIYDTGADLLYLDEDFLSLGNLQNTFGRKGRAQMGGAGNSGPIQVEMFVDPVRIRCGALNYTNRMTPVIRLRDILGRHTDGLLGNTHLLNSPLEINFSERYIRQFDTPIPTDLLQQYHKLEARFINNRINVKAMLKIDSANVAEGWFLMDLGCGGSVVLTQEAYSSLDLSGAKKVYYHTQAGGVGGASDECVLRAECFTVTDEFENVVVTCSLNKQGALSTNRPYLGVIGNKIWSLYDLVLDPATSSVWVKRNGDRGIYSEASTTHMTTVDRTDICDGWIVNGLFKGGIAERGGFEIGDVILSINGRPVKEISWEEQRNGLDLKGETKYRVRKKSGETVSLVLTLGNPII